MNTLPLIKTKMNNEHIMTELFGVLVLYHLPQWYGNPSGILRFLLLVGFGLIIDAVASFLRYKRLWCCVSGAVSAAIISLLSFGIPLWGQLAGIAFGLIVGKHIQGGTGKNLSNPAIAGLVLILLCFGLPDKLFSSSMLLLPAIILGLMFLTVRPFAGIGFIAGMLVAMLVNQELTLANILSYGVFFWGCIILTDPVTITPRPAVGALLGFTTSYIAMFLFKTPTAIVAVILVINVFTDDLMKAYGKNTSTLKASFRIPKVFSHVTTQTPLIDLTGEKDTPQEGSIKEDSAKEKQLTADEILERIRVNEVFGMGGAAFPTYRKIITLKEAVAEDKYLIINAVECDPGLIHDEWLLINHFSEIMKGVDLLNTCVKFKEVHLAVKNKGKLMESLQVKVDQVMDRYPIGAEKILIADILGKKLGIGEIPSASGILVLNVQTVYAISQAVLKNKPVETRILTVADLKEKTAKVVKVKLGMKLQEIMDKVYPGTVNIFAGGGIMQAYLAEEEAVVDRNINFLATGLMPKYKESPQCSRCGACSKNCPSGLQVREIAELVDHDKLEETIKYSPEECISCGSCSYSCLAGRNLAVKVKRAKEFIRDKKAEVGE